MRIAVLVLALSAAPAWGQGKTEGFFLSPRAFGVAYNVSGSDEGLDSGGGVGVRLGSSLSESVALYLGVDYAAMGVNGGALNPTNDDDYGLTSFDVGAQVQFLPSERLVPFARAGLTGTLAIYSMNGQYTSGDPQLLGGGVTLGGGVEYEVSRSLGVEVSVGATGGVVGHVGYGGLRFATREITRLESSRYLTGRAALALVWRPRASWYRSARGR